MYREPCWRSVAAGVLLRGIPAVGIAAALACTSPNPTFDPSTSPDSSVPLDVSSVRPDARPVDRGLPPADVRRDRGLPPDAAGPKPVGIDVLFVVDNSPGMAAAQARLARDVDTLLSRLAELPGDVSFRVGVVTSDMGVGPFVNKSCSAAGDAGKLQLPPWCPATVSGKPYIQGSGVQLDVPLVDEALSCMLQVGEEGCGFEQPLEAMRAALKGTKGFIRDEAALVVVILANEDDCSVADQSLFDPYIEAYGPYASYRCFQFGTLCGGKAPPSQADVLSGCAPGQAYLQPIKARYVDALTALKPPGWVAALAVVGPSDAPIKVVEAENYQGAYWKVAPSCVSSKISGDPAVRLRAWSAGFGAHGSQLSICNTNYREGLVRLVNLLRPLF